MEEEAAHLMKYVATNPEFLRSYAKDTGDFIANQKIAEEIKGDFSEELLGGQN